MSEHILREGRNCWKIANASRVKFLIDGAAYFSTLADAFEQERKDHREIPYKNMDVESAPPRRQ